MSNYTKTAQTVTQTLIQFIAVLLAPIVVFLLVALVGVYFQSVRTVMIGGLFTVCYLVMLAAVAMSASVQFEKWESKIDQGIDAESDDAASDAILRILRAGLRAMKNSLGAFAGVSIDAISWVSELYIWFGQKATSYEYPFQFSLGAPDWMPKTFSIGFFILPILFGLLYDRARSKDVARGIHPLKGSAKKYKSGLEIFAVIEFFPMATLCVNGIFGGNSGFTLSSTLFNGLFEFVMLTARDFIALGYNETISYALLEALGPISFGLVYGLIPVAGVISCLRDINISKGVSKAKDKTELDVLSVNANRILIVFFSSLLVIGIFVGIHEGFFVRAAQIIWTVLVWLFNAMVAIVSWIISLFQ